MGTFLYGMAAFVIVLVFAGLCEHIKAILKKKVRQNHQRSFNGKISQ
jgi:hypothetical protein